ncbi:MAG: acetate--CoA ligase family protein [Candidatus Schekmanbacteria bacterium]|nr:acetate--CoA ligase family protein [Candidatus Schekmanbacteria bacterium]
MGSKAAVTAARLEPESAPSRRHATSALPAFLGSRTHSAAENGVALETSLSTRLLICYHIYFCDKLLGGIWVETLRDVTFRLAPVRRYGAERMVAGIRAANLLAGVRGAPPADRAAIATCLQRLSQLAIELPEVTELDINPLIVGPVGSGATVVDARILL